jgi:DNA-binding GntR family transcriptional regulator
MNGWTIPVPAVPAEAPLDPVAPRRRRYIEPVDERVVSKAAEIARVIQEAIVNGDLAPGTVLRQEQLSKELGISRTPVREALQQVAALGLVTLEPNRGARVRSPSHSEVQERSLIRAELEALAAQLAVARITDDEVEELRERQQRLAGLTASLSADASGRQREWLISEWTSANLAFHDAILESAKAPVLMSTTRSIRTGAVLSAHDWTPRFARHAELSDAEHAKIVDAFSARDQKVRGLLRQHILGSLKYNEAIDESQTRAPRRLLPPLSVRSGSD